MTTTTQLGGSYIGVELSADLASAALDKGLALYPPPNVFDLGGANFGPSWTPDGKRIIFSSNHKNPRGGNFDLYLINPDGSGLGCRPPPLRAVTAASGHAAQG